jgi:hypothetical protein
VLGEPLTVYGRRRDRPWSAGHPDTVECIRLAVENPADAASSGF